MHRCLSLFCLNIISIVRIGLRFKYYTELCLLAAIFNLYKEEVEYLLDRKYFYAASVSVGVFV